MNLLDELIEAWRYTRAGVIAEAENLPAERFLDRPGGLTRSPLELVNHIVESGWLMAGELTRPDGDFQRLGYAELLAEHTPTADRADGREAALRALRRSHEQGEARLREAGHQTLARPIRQFNGVEASRISWMHHGISHEEYHRGQLALYARLFGETPALTKQILGEEG
jgi:uncharacterized damage-inducible protein DinB